MDAKNAAIAIGLIFAIAGVGWWFSTTKDDRSVSSAAVEGAPIVEVRLPETLTTQAQVGQIGFDTLCAECHGENAAGRNGVAPPLVHRIYEPSHHGDAAFLLAAQNGVRAHHWNFGNMPPVEGVTRADVMAITAYVRELQRANGIN